MQDNNFLVLFLNFEQSFRIPLHKNLAAFDELDEMEEAQLSLKQCKFTFYVMFLYRLPSSLLKLAILISEWALSGLRQSLMVSVRPVTFFWSPLTVDPSRNCRLQWLMIVTSFSYFFIIFTTGFMMSVSSVRGPSSGSTIVKVGWLQKRGKLFMTINYFSFS